LPEETPLEIKKISSDQNLKSIRLGDESFTPLKTFLKNDALLFHEKDIAKTWVITKKDSNHVAAYITLMCSEIKTEKGVTDCPEADKYEIFPAIKIARLAVDKR